MSWGMTRIVFPEGELMLPDQTPYDLEVVLGEARWYAMRHGQVLLHLRQHTWLVRAMNGRGPLRCVGCAAVASVVFDDGSGTVMCLRCARAEVEHEHGARWWRAALDGARRWLGPQGSAPGAAAGRRPARQHPPISAVWQSPPRSAYARGFSS